MIQSGKMLLGGSEFEVKDDRMTGLSIFESDEEDGTYTVSIEVWFKEGEFRGENVKPMIVINPHETGLSSVEELIGTEYTVESVEEAEEREDTLYVFEHEPFINYTMKILDLNDGIAKVSIRGTAITDGYSEPEQTAELDGEFLLKYSADEL